MQLPDFSKKAGLLLTIVTWLGQALPDISTKLVPWDWFRPQELVSDVRCFLQRLLLLQIHA